MIYPSTFENKIGFDKIREAIIEKCSGALSKEEARKMSFLSDYEEIRTLLWQTDEMLHILNSGDGVPLRDVGDTVSYIAEIRAEGSYMPAARLYKLLTVLEQSREVYDYFNTRSGNSDTPEGELHYPCLAKIAERLRQFPELIHVINRCVNKFGEVKDTASDRLYEIRKSLRAANGSMSKAMRRVMDRAMAEGVIDKDASPSVRDGRLVIPVEAGKKRSITGIVHDASATGKTVYIEPLEVVEAGNRIRELELEQRHEEIEVLKNVAVTLRPHINDIVSTCKVLARLDFIKAKALFAIEVDGRLPHLENKRLIEWYHAVHPQLLLALRQQGKEVVALNLTLDDKNRILIISGPNAGGKSVCLKTV